MCLRVCSIKFKSTFDSGPTLTEAPHTGEKRNGRDLRKRHPSTIGHVVGSRKLSGSENRMRRFYSSHASLNRSKIISGPLSGAAALRLKLMRKDYLPDKDGFGNQRD
jgi:hypothetical protein